MRFENKGNLEWMFLAKLTAINLSFETAPDQRLGGTKTPGNSINPCVVFNGKQFTYRSIQFV